MSTQYVSNNYDYDSLPITVTCFNCKNIVVTTTSGSANAVCCFLFGCCALMCSGCKDVEHRCPQCNVILGTYKPC